MGVNTRIYRKSYCKITKEILSDNLDKRTTPPPEGRGLLTWQVKITFKYDPRYYKTLYSK